MIRHTLVFNAGTLELEEARSILKATWHPQRGRAWDRTFGVPTPSSRMQAMAELTKATGCDIVAALTKMPLPCWSHLLPG